MPIIIHEVTAAAAQILANADVDKVESVGKRIVPEVCSLTLGENLLLIERLALLFEDQTGLCPLCLLREIGRQREAMDGFGGHAPGHA